MDQHTFDDDPVQVYLRELCSVPALTESEERDLESHVSAGDEQAESARVRLMEANLAMVVEIARRHARPGLHILDLIQKGNEGLLSALQTFSKDANMRFAAYAADRVEKAVTQAATAP